MGEGGTGAEPLIWGGSTSPYHLHHPNATFLPHTHLCCMKEQQNSKHHRFPQDAACAGEDATLLAFSPNTVVLRLRGGKLCVLPAGAHVVLWPQEASLQQHAPDSSIIQQAHGAQLPQPLQQQLSLQAQVRVALRCWLLLPSGGYIVY